MENESTRNGSTMMSNPTIKLPLKYEFTMTTALITYAKVIVIMSARADVGFMAIALDGCSNATMANSCQSATLCTVFLPRT